MIDKDYIKDMAILRHSRVIDDVKADSILREIRAGIRGKLCLRGYVHNVLDKSLIN